MFNRTKDKVIQLQTMTKYKVKHTQLGIGIGLGNISTWQHSPPARTNILLNVANVEVLPMTMLPVSSFCIVHSLL